MKRKYLTFLLGLFMLSSLHAQDIYKVEALTSEDLNGTARFVGMGGAMSALGADLSTMGTNPAGIGMYRNSDLSLSGSATVQSGAHEFAGHGRAAGSFDQAGFVYAIKLDDKLNFFNFGFNYHKRYNAKNYAGKFGVQTNGLSQSLQMLDLLVVDNRWLDIRNAENPDCDKTTPFALLGYDTYMIDPTYDANGVWNGYEAPNYANSYDYRKVQWGGIDQYDFNLSLNWEDRVYAGLTFGLYDVNLHSVTGYSEWLEDPVDVGMENEYYAENEKLIYGSGFDVKAGLIVRPFEESPFRLGFSVATPTFYDLTAESYLYMNAPHYDENNQLKSVEADFQSGPYEYKIRTPWKINVSAATTVGTNFALDAEYEFSNFSGAQVRRKHHTYYDYDSRSSKDEALCNEIDRFMKPVHTFRVGAEARADKFYCRAGYNYVTAPFEKDAYLNQFTSSPSYYNQVNTDYINLGDTHRITCGFGFRSKYFYGDVAYQYQVQKGDLYAFHVPVSENLIDTNALQGQSLNFERHNILFTIGCKF